jgi:hypothetical protein
MDSTLMTLNNNSSSNKMDKFCFDSVGDGMKGNGVGALLPSFHDILWCPDVDGEVLDPSEMGGSLVRHIPHFFVSVNFKAGKIIDVTKGKKGSKKIQSKC